MVIDDTPEIRALFQELLAEEGYEVVAYADAIRDLAEVERVQPDLIILDHIIAGEAVGLTILQQLKRRRSTAQIPVIVCTAAANDVEEMEGSLKGKGVGLVLKPFAIDDLLAAVDQALERGRGGGRLQLLPHVP